MGQLAFYFDSSKCTGCKTCQVVCKENHGLPVANKWRKVVRYEGGAWEPVESTGYYRPEGLFSYNISMSCNHCEQPICMEMCPAGAIEKDAETGIVSIDETRCIGCQTCVNTCPYGAPTYLEEAGVSSKCDMCKDRLDAGEKPYCVASCLMRALDFGEVEELRARYGDGDIEIEPLPANTTGATTILNPHPKAQKSGKGTGAVVSFDEEQ